MAKMKILQNDTTPKEGKVTFIRKICNFLGFEKSYNLPLCESSTSLILCCEEPTGLT